MRFRIGDRVEVVDGGVSREMPRVGTIMGTAAADNFLVALVDGNESIFSPAQLVVPPPISADLIFDTRISPVSEMRGGSSGRHMRFICRDFDIHLKIMGSQQRTLIGQLTQNGSAPDPALVTLLFESKPYARTATDTLGEFQLEQLRDGHALLEILVPSCRMLTTFDTRTLV
jgi:hypothetical protein